MRIWFDTEFIEDGKTIDLLSIGMVREDGLTYYAEPVECDTSRASPWVRENVLPHMRRWTLPLTVACRPRAHIAREIVAFAGKKPEFWAYYADYDWVALCQLFGTMMQLPDGWPMYCRDVTCRAMGRTRRPSATGSSSPLTSFLIAHIGTARSFPLKASHPIPRSGAVNERGS